jgi:hypothetical protein
MKLVKFRTAGGDVRAGIWEDQHVIPLRAPQGPLQSLEPVLESDRPGKLAESSRDTSAALPLDQVQLVAPLDRQ